MAGGAGYEAVRVAVIGAGRWGRLHAEKWASMPGARLVGVVDHDLGRAKAATAQMPSVAAFRTLEQLPPDVQACSVAVGIDSLSKVAMAALERGLHVLVEKPMATSLAAAERLHAEAQRTQRVLAVGYLERFNPAVDLECQPPRRYVSHRVGPNVGGARDWLLDWLVHDIDLAHAHFREPLRFEGARFGPSGVGLRLSTPSGGVARLYAGAAPSRRRRIWIDGRVCDLLAQPGDPLAHELSQFLECVRGERPGRLALSGSAVSVLSVVDVVRRLSRAA